MSNSRDSGSGNGLLGHVGHGVVVGFLLSGAFFLFWGAFELVGFFLWSVVGGGGGAALGSYIARTTRFRLAAALAGAVVVRVLIFLFFGTF